MQTGADRKQATPAGPETALRLRKTNEDLPGKRAWHIQIALPHFKKTEHTQYEEREPHEKRKTE